MEKMFVEIIEKKNAGVNLDERYTYQYPIVMTYLKRKLKGWVFWDFFNRFQTARIALYAITEFTELIIGDYENYKGTCCIECIADRNYKMFYNGYMNYKVVNLKIINL